MSGHNKWSQIKHRKATTDAVKSRVFSRLVRLIKTEARIAKSDMNAPALKAAIERARAENMPKENIDRAIKSATEGGTELTRVTYEGYGPGGVALIIEGLTDSTNRTSQEIKHLFAKNRYVLASPGAAAWAFEKTTDGWTAKTTTPLSDEDIAKLETFVDEIENHGDVQNVYTNAE